MKNKTNFPVGLSRRSSLQMGSVLLLLGMQSLARGTTIMAVRVWPAKDYTRLTIESDDAIKARQFIISEPPRLAIDIEGVDLIPALRELITKVRPDDPHVAGIRVGQSVPGVVRLVMDLKQAIQPQVFSLPPVAAYQHRLVFDLYPSLPTDPLESLFNEERLRSQQETPSLADTPAPTADDPLGDLIAQQFSKAANSSSASAARPAPSRAPLPGRSRPRTDRLVIVALDPGHGGEDPGAIGPGGTREKDVVLQIALRLRDRINRQPNMRAYLTRDSDFFVPLHVRVEKARKVKADLFISLHADAFFTAAPAGASIFALSAKGASSSAARWLADKENSADLVGGVNIKVKDAHVRRALFDMSTTAQINDSMKLGSAMLGEIGNVGKLHKPRVEQAGFAVLKAPDIPSVLVETAFISNPAEETRLRSASYQNQLANALMRGISQYFARNPPLARNRTV